MNHGVRSVLEAGALIAMGLGSLAFALGEDYSRLMNADFRTVTIGGASLVLVMGLVLMLRPRRVAGRGALIVFGLFFAVVAVGRPAAPGVAPLRPESDAAPPLERPGYDPLRVRALFDTILGDDADIEEGTYVLSGFAHRTPDSDAEGAFYLIEPQMACCLADAIALGLRVNAAGSLPEVHEWYYAYGTLRRRAEPLDTPRFRVGAILFTVISRHYVLEAEDILPLRALMPNIVEMIPPRRCRLFREALASSGLAKSLKEEGPFTVFAPLDLAFDRLLRTERDALFAPENAEMLRARLEDFIVPGSHTKGALHGTDVLTAISGRALEVETIDGKLEVEGARILFGDQIGRNGVVHIVHPGWLNR